jgi:integrase/recombinase XerD
MPKGGTTFTPGALQKALERHTRARFGHVVNTHLFRDCVATTIAYDDPEHIRICARILGHSRFSTTEGHYIVAKTVAAADHYHNLIEAIRSPRPKRRAAP